MKTKTKRVLTLVTAGVVALATVWVDSTWADTYKYVGRHNTSDCYTKTSGIGGMLDGFYYAGTEHPSKVILYPDIEKPPIVLPAKRVFLMHSDQGVPLATFYLDWGNEPYTVSINVCRWESK